MYCIECGAQILESSKFCPECGKKQDLEQSIKDIDTEVNVKQNVPINKPESSSSNSKYLKIFRKNIGWYSFWFLFHFIILLIFSEGIFKNSSNGLKDFWPINNFLSSCERCTFIDEYDITEFIFYTGIPLAFIFITNLMKENKEQQILEKD